MIETSFRRALSTTRKELPLLTPLVSFVLGQIAGFAGVMFVTSALALMPLLLSLCGFKLRATLISAGLVICGALSSLRFQSETFLPNRDQIHSAIVKSPIRRARVGEAVLSLTLLGAPNSQILCNVVELPWRNSVRLKGGERILFRAEFRTLSKAHFLSYDATLVRQGYSSTCRITQLRILGRPQGSIGDRQREKISQAVRAVLGNGERAGLFLAMGLGTRDVISEETEIAFRRTGLSHLLVLSGYQVTLLFVFLHFIFLAIMRRFFIQAININIKALSSFAAFCFCCAFVSITSVEHSSMRAIFAAALVALTVQLERGRGNFHCLIAALFVMSLLWPGCYLEPGVQLTFAALVGLGLSRDEESSDGLRDYFKACFYASLFTSVVVLLWFDGLSVVGVVLNPILAPAFSFLSCNVGFSALALLGLRVGNIGSVILEFVADLLEILRDFVVWISEFQWIYVSGSGWGKYLVSLALIVWCGRIALRKIKNELENRGVYLPTPRDYR